MTSDPALLDLQVLAGPWNVPAQLEDDDPLSLVGEEVAGPVKLGAFPVFDEPEPPATAAWPEQGDTALADPNLVELGPVGIRPWRIAQSLLVLRAELNGLFPKRDRASDGAIGDPAHASRKSDHNPWVVVDDVGVVRAVDIDRDGIPCGDCVEHIRKLGKEGFPPLQGQAYLIFQGRIASDSNNWVWRRYRGVNPHDKHFHVSVSTARNRFDSTQPWGLAKIFGGSAGQDSGQEFKKVKPGPGPVTPNHQHLMPVVKINDVGHPDAVRDIQGHLTAWRRNRNLSDVPRDGRFNETTHIALQTFQRTYGLPASGVCDERTWKTLHYITKGVRAS